jgi:hypothetical protein
MLEFDEGECKDLQVSGTREWLIVNGMGARFLDRGGHEYAPLSRPSRRRNRSPFRAPRSPFTA